MKKAFKIFMLMVAIVVFVGMVPSSTEAATTAKNYKTSNVTVKDTKKKTVNTYKATKKKIKKVTCSNKNVKIKVAKNKKSFTIVAKKSMNKTVKVCVKFTNKKTKVYKVKFTKKNNGDVTSEDTEDTSDDNTGNDDNDKKKKKDDRDRHEHTWVALTYETPIYEQHVFNKGVDITQAIRDFNTMNGTDIFYTMTDVRQNKDGLYDYLKTLGPVNVDSNFYSQTVIVGYDTVTYGYECSTCHETK